MKIQVSETVLEEEVNAPPHPWLEKAPWLVKAARQLFENLGQEDEIQIALDQQRGHYPTAGVSFITRATPDELDDYPGVRKIERRAAELAFELPAQPPFGASIRITRNEIAAAIRWYLPGKVILLARREADRWQAADLINIHARHVMIAQQDIDDKTPRILDELARVLRPMRLQRDKPLYSAISRDNEIRVVIGAGGIQLPDSMK